MSLKLKSPLLRGFFGKLLDAKNRGLSNLSNEMLLVRRYTFTVCKPSNIDKVIFNIADAINFLFPASNYC